MPRSTGRAFGRVSRVTVMSEPAPVPCENCTPCLRAFMIEQLCFHIFYLNSLFSKKKQEIIPNVRNFTEGTISGTLSIQKLGKKRENLEIKKSKQNLENLEIKKTRQNLENQALLRQKGLRQ